MKMIMKTTLSQGRRGASYLWNKNDIWSRAWSSPVFSRGRGPACSMFSFREGESRCFSLNEPDSRNRMGE